MLTIIEGSKIHPIDNDYRNTIVSLFRLLLGANQSDSIFAKKWQKSTDANQNEYYGYIRQAIIEVAGIEIIEHWTETNQIDLNLANRK